MYPSRFRYEAPRSIDEAIALLQHGGGEAKVLAGGQSLVPLLKLRFAAPELLVDINNLPGLDYHRVDADGTHPDRRAVPARRPGALDAPDDASSRRWPRPRPLIADPIVRNRGTLVGSLCHADPQGDWASVVTALGGYVVAQGSDGRRTIPVAEFVTGPFQNALAYDEIAVEAVIPAPKGTVAGGYLKLERRVGDFATAGVAVALELSGAVVTRAGIALTGVGGSTIDATDAAQALVGGPLTADSIGARRRPGGAGRPAPDRPPRQRRVQAAHRAHVRRAHPDPRRSSQRRGQPDMTSLFEEIREPAGRRRAGAPGHASRSTASGGRPTSSRGCCWPTCCARASG